MEDRKTINDKIVNWIVDRVKKKYPDDISMVLIYGSYVNGTANRMSDVDCYFIPKTQRGYDMAVDFLVAGAGYDVFPMSWERVENIAACKEVLLPCLGDVRIIYSHSEEETKRFRGLQEKLQKNLQDETYIKHIVKEKFSGACEMYSEMGSQTDTAGVRKFAGYIIMTLAETVALSRHDYFHFGLKRQWEDLQTKIPDVPKEWLDQYLCVVQAPNNDICKKHCGAILRMTADLLGLECNACEKEQKNLTNEEVRPNYQWLAGLYEEISSTFNKIYICCENGNYVLAFLSAVCLQGELDEAVGFGAKSYDLLTSYQHTNLSRLADEAREIEKDFVQHILDGGGNIKRYQSFDEFVKADL